MEQALRYIATKPLQMYNAHVHLFTLHHVPDAFARGFRFIGWVRLSWLTKSGLLRWIFKRLPSISKLGPEVRRMLYMVKHGNQPTQEAVLKGLMAYYPRHTRFIALPMDMDYMGASVAPVSYPVQLQELLKLTEKYPDELFPFAFADPRRLSDDATYWPHVEEEIRAGRIKGIKLYPALGYWPFDARLKPVYDFALKHKIPLITHCVEGIVFDRGPKRYWQHPIFPEIALPGKRAREYAQHFTHPLNYHGLMSVELLKRIWPGDRVTDYKELKMCLAHFGGSDEWLEYLKNPFLADTDGQHNKSPLDPGQWDFSRDREKKRYSWFSIIRELLYEYPAMYADISFTIGDPQVWPLIKVLLTDSRLSNRILFGTDYYMVAQKDAERSLSIGLRAFLGEELFWIIAKKNVEAYLSTDFIQFREVT